MASEVSHGTGSVANAEALLRAPLVAVLDSLPDAAFLYAADGQIVRANAAARTLFGLDAAPEFAGLPYHERVARLAARDGSGQPLPQDRWYITRLLSGEAITGDDPFDATITTLDGRERMMSFTGTPIRDAAGTLLGAVALGRDVTAQRQAERAEQAAHNRLAAVQTVMDTALAHLSPDALLRELLARIRAAMGADNAAILLNTHGGEYLTVTTALGAEEAVVGAAHIPMGEGVAGRIAATRAPLLVDDLAAIEVANPLLRERFRSLVGVPLAVGDRLLGVLHVDSEQPHHFTQDDVGLLALVAERVAVAIDRARLFEAAERERRAAAARAQELETFFGTLADAVMLFGPTGEVTLLNPAARALLGPAADSVDRPQAERGVRAAVLDEHGEPLPESEWPYVRVLRGEVLTGPDAVDVVYTWPEGRTLQVSVSGAPVRDPEGNITGALCILHDVTERRALERRTHEALSALLEMARALVLEHVSPEEAGQPRAQVIAQRLAELTCQVLGCSRVGITAVDPETETLRAIAVVGLPPDQETQWWSVQRELELRGVRLGDGADADMLARFRAGEVLVLDMTQPPYSDLPNPYGVTTQLVAPMRAGEALVGILSLDYGGPPHAFTEDERALAGAVAQLGGLVVERERLLHERATAQAAALALEEANRRMNEFLSIASHELRTPLTVIKTNLQLLARLRERSAVEPVEDARRSSGAGREVLLMERSERQVDRLVRLVEDMLDVSRVQQGKLEMRMESADLLGVVREEVEQQRHAHPTRDIHLMLPETPVPVVVDQGRIGQVVTNYLTNALKYSPGGQPVEVWVSVADDIARVCVKDQGPGLPPEEHERVWQMFHRAEGIEVLSGSGVGLGLGLHIARTIVERHGGQVGIESAPGHGSTFWFTLPLAADAAANPDPRPLLDVAAN